MAVKKLDNKTKILIGLWLILLPTAILVARRAHNNTLKIFAFALVALGYAFIEFMKIRGFKEMGELEKTIQLEIYAVSFSIFTSFLFVLMIFIPTFVADLEGMGVLAIVIFGSAIIQLTSSIIIKKKYE